MKAEKEHPVPLSEPAIELLKSIQTDIEPQSYIFLVPRTGGMLPDMSLTDLIKRMHEQKLKNIYLKSFWRQQPYYFQYPNLLSQHQI